MIISGFVGALFTYGWSLVGAILGFIFIWMLRRSAAQERMEKTLKEMRNNSETAEQRKARYEQEYKKNSDHCANCGKYMLVGFDRNPLCGQCQKLERDRQSAEENSKRTLNEELEDTQKRLAEYEKKLAELEKKIETEKNKSTNGTELK